MAYTIGGSIIQKIELTKSWGSSPGSARVTCPGVVSIGAGTDGVITLGGATFSGVITNNPVQASDGAFTEFSYVDNRIKLQWDEVRCMFNHVEVRADNPDTPGIDRQKRYWHILPADWQKQVKTWTATPFSAQEIITKLFAAPTVHHAWGGTFHPAQAKPVYRIDANQGAKLGNVLQEISDQQGLVFTLDGSSQLVWARKGEGEVPTPPANVADQLRLGDALSHNDTEVTLIGDQNLYQELSVNLVPDWNDAYEDWWAEPAWLKEVDEDFGPFGADNAGQAELFQKARSVTLRQFSEAQDEPDEFVDFGLWGEVSRMEIPVWVYLQDIVFKAYRVSPDYEMNGVGVDDLELSESGLLAACEHSLDGEISLKTNPDTGKPEYYPETKAFVIVQGQPLDLLDPRRKDAITKEQLDAAATLWTAHGRFQLDTRNSGPSNKKVIFESAVFVPGTGDEGLFLFPNQGVVGVEEDTLLHNVCVPNANVTITHAAVKASLVWEGERFSRTYGSGVRKGSRYVHGLSQHTILSEGSFQQEVRYSDDHDAVDKANEFSLALLERQATYLSGGYRRMDGAGTQLNGTIDRITVSMDFENGLTETVEYTKERAPVNFHGERDLDRQQRVRELFPGQAISKKDVENLRRLATIYKSLKRTNPTPAYRSIAEVVQRPVGAEHPGVVTFHGGNSAGVPAPGGDSFGAEGGGETPENTIWKAGQPVFLDEAGSAAANGKNFCGIVIAEGSSGPGIAAATQGTVPVRVRGPFVAGDAIGIDAGPDQTAKVGGAMALGVASASYAGSEIVLAPVRLGAGGGGVAAVTHPFQPYRPPSAATAFELAIRPAFVDTMPAENETEIFAVPANRPQGYFFWAEVDLSASGGLMAWRIDHGPVVPVADAPDETTGEPPTPAYFLICAVTSDATGVILDPAREYATTNKIRKVNVTDIADGVKTREVTFIPSGPEAYYRNFDP